MALTEIWVPRLGAGTEADPYRPDLPYTGVWPDGRYDVAWQCDDGAPADLAAGDGRPATAHMNVLVAEADVARCPRRIAVDAVPEADRQLVAMLRQCRGDYERRAEGFFGAIANLASADADRKRAMKSVLLQAVARGLSPTRAEAIRVRHALPAAEEVTRGS